MTPDGQIPGASGSPGDLPEENTLILMKSAENLGFAGGVNMGIRAALRMGIDFVFLLNNDTTVDPACIGQLRTFLERNRNVGGVVPTICYYHEPGRVWNCGGKLTWTGSRRYYGFGRKAGGPCDKIRKITFSTGCALLMRADVLRRHGLLSEAFFFGEEDYEFSRRLRDGGVELKAYGPARVYHKVAVAQNAVFHENTRARAFIYYLNRFVHLKTCYPFWYWKVWRAVSLLYILPLMVRRHGLKLNRVGAFARGLLEDSAVKERVTRDDFFQAVNRFS
jgi:hypothetical protein